MWHQIAFAFARYFIFQEIQLLQAAILITVCIILSILTYNFIEKPFRNKNFITAKVLLIVTCSWGLILLTSSFYIYSKDGIIRNVPELGIFLTELNKNSATKDYLDTSYNNRIKKLNNAFSEKHQFSLSKIKVLIVGDSFARDFANILLESEYKDRIEISYFETNKPFNADLQQRIKKADVIFYGSFRPSDERLRQYNLKLKKVWIIGVKNFGNSNGIAYNKHIVDYTSYRAPLKKEIWEDNLKYNKNWGNHYIDLVTLLTNENKKIKIFTPSRQFISQDTRHFTREGAKYYAQLLNEKISNILNQAK
jgi:Fe-S cluster biosynthesis and repair protein YggX